MAADHRLRAGLDYAGVLRAAAAGDSQTKAAAGANRQAQKVTSQHEWFFLEYLMRADADYRRAGRRGRRLPIR
jgi:hypothetical protein